MTERIDSSNAPASPGRRKFLGATAAVGMIGAAAGGAALMRTGEVNRGARNETPTGAQHPRCPG
jgi:nitrous-oxide reductase